MEHGLNTALVVAIGVALLVWSLVSARFERWSVTAPIVFVALGFTLTHGWLAAAHVGLSSATARSLAELTLALVLFSDASRVDADELRADAALPARLLGIGLPLSIAIGFGLTAVLQPGVGLWVAALMAVIVAPTDAALGAAVMSDERVPHRVRTVLNVESGLNDGIVTPFVGVFLAAAIADETSSGGGGVTAAIVDLIAGAGVGIAVGAVGAIVLRLAVARGLAAAAFRPLVPVALALVCYAAAVEAGFNGFVAAFVGGIAFGRLRGDSMTTVTEFAEHTGELLSLLTWFLFGAAMLAPGLEHATWRDVVLAILALTVMRMVPVALACVGLGLGPGTVGFIGWFGPRGLASVIFGLLSIDSLTPGDAQHVLSFVTVTVALSVVLHGVTAAPLAGRFDRRQDASTVSLPAS